MAHIMPRDSRDLPLVEELVPAPQPWDVAQRLAHLPHLLFLDSAEFHAVRGRHSYVAADPLRLLFLSAEDWPAGERIAKECLAHGLLNRPEIPELPPFIGGWAGLFDYHLGRAFEEQPRPRNDEFQSPTCALCLYDWVYSFDHQDQRGWLVSTGMTGDEASLQPRGLRAETRLRFIEQLIRDGAASGTATAVRQLRFDPRQPKLTPVAQYPLPGLSGVTSNFSRPEFEAAIRRAVEYIHAGDCYQVNLSQRLLASQRDHALTLYGRLRERNPAPFGGYFDLGEFQIASASPERFLKVASDGHVETRPIKGTRPRGETDAQDEANRSELLSSEKDRAENVMIVDLLRNDLGRVCEYGSIQVTKVCELESFRTVHHLVSEVVGKLRADRTAFDLLRAAFPGGSITGAPKVRAMEIIAELEPTARGPYCGSLGYLGFDGAMDSSILIRTFTAGRGWLQFPVGGGIVAESEPATEYDETIHKAAGLLRALE